MFSFFTAKGITDQLRRVILLQLLFISLLTVLGVFVSAKVVEGVMMRAALEGEAAHFWQLFESNQTQALPDTDNLKGYLARSGNMQGIPAQLVALEPGFGRVSIGDKKPLVMSEAKGGDILYLVFDEQSVSKLSFYFGVVPLSLALIVIYFTAWIGFRHTRKAVSPMVQLAKTMEQFDIESHALEELDFTNLDTGQKDSEVAVLVQALNGFTGKITAMLERERLFTRDASHELRTPLTVLQGSAEWLLHQGDLDDKQQQVVKRVLRTSRDMTELVHALLVLARSEKAPLESASINVCQLVEELSSELSKTHNQDQHVELSVIHQGKCDIYTSRQLLSIVIGNLLRNAFNYTNQGKVTVTVDSNSVSVVNQGEGVEVSDMSRLFDVFYREGQQGKPTVAEDVPESFKPVRGYGVGLDIVKRLCETLNWQIKVDQHEKIGMRFTVEFSAD